MNLDLVLINPLALIILIPRILHSVCVNHYVNLFITYFLYHYSLHMLPIYTIIPQCWKVHKVVPTFKASDPNLVINYYPFLFCLRSSSKVLERLIFDKLIDYITKSSYSYSLHMAQLRTVQPCSMQMLILFLTK